MRSPWFVRVTAGSSTGELARTVDWAATPIGPPSTWPSSLRALVETCFSTRFPVLVTWGPALTMIYNDGYRDMLGSDKHPGAMGAPLAAVWAEVWDDIGPSVAHVLESGEPTWVEDQFLVMERSGFVEETYFTYSYSPLRDSADVVQGVLDIATETTERVVERRRAQLLGELSIRLAAAHGDLAAIGDVAVELLGASADLAGAAVYLRDADGLVPLVLTGAESAGEAMAPSEVLDRVARTNVAVQVDRTLVAPLSAAGDRTSEGVVVLRAGERRPWDAPYRAFVRLAATAVAEAASGTRRHLREVAELTRISDVLQAAMLPEGSALPGVVARYRPAVGSLAVGGDWYDVVELEPGRRALVIGDCVGHGLDAAARMGQLRSAARALLLENPSPAAALDGLDRFATTLPGAEFTTVVCGVVDEVAHTVTYATAGHLPPVLVRVDGTIGWLDQERGASLTLARRPRQEATEVLADGDVVILYTDGLVERRGESLRAGLARLADAVGRHVVGATAEELVDRLLRELTPHGGADDVAIVVYQAGVAGFAGDGSGTDSGAGTGPGRGRGQIGRTS